MASGFVADDMTSSSSDNDDTMDSAHPQAPAPLIPFFFETSPPSPSATTSSRFFRLPREIRDEVYDLLWRNTRMYPREGDFTFDFFYGQYHSDWRVCRLPPGMSACKLLLSESIQQYYRHAQCVGYNERSVSCATSPFKLLSLYRMKKLVARTMTGPAMGSVRMILRIGPNAHESRLTREIARPSEANGKVYAVPEGTNSRGPQPAFAQLCQQLSLHKHRVRDITVRFSVPANWQAFTVVGVKQWILDVSMLQQFGTNFDRAEFIINAPQIRFDYFRRTRSKMARLVVFYRMLQVALEDLGKALVGVGVGVCSNVRDWIDDGEGPRDWHVEVSKTAQGKRAAREVSPNGWKGVQAWGRTSCDMSIDGNGWGRMNFFCEATQTPVQINVPTDEKIKCMGGGLCSFADDGTLD